MILKCPQCGEEYEVSSNNGKVENFTMKCHSCGARINSDENEEIEVRRLSTGMEPIAVTKKKSKSGCLWTFVVFVVLIGVLAISKPDKSKHAEKIHSWGIQYLHEETKDDAGLLKDLALLFGPALMDIAIDNVLIVDDYIIFNVGKIKYEEIDKTITIGVLNNVFFLPTPNNTGTQSEDVTESESE